MFLRPFLLFVSLIAGMVAFAQQRVTIFSEGFGDGALQESVTDYTGWDNPEAAYEGTGRIGNMTYYSCRLPGSSGRGYLYFSSDNIRNIKFCHINIAGYHDLQLSYNLKKNKVNSGTLQVDVYVDNKKVSSYKPVLKDDDEWFAVPVHSLPQGSVLDLALSNGDTNVTLYLDDFTITGLPDVVPVPDVPQVTPAEGLYTAPVRLTLTAASGASVYYTLDGSMPTEKSEKYQSPVLLDHSATLSAVAVSVGGQSELLTARYEIMNVPTVADVLEFRESGSTARLDLVQAEVVDAGADGFCVQTARGGLLMPPQSVDAVVGDRLNGFLVGTPQKVYRMTGVSDGVFSQISVVHGSTAPVPLSVGLSEVLAQPERYTACLLQLQGMTYRPEDGTVCQKESPDGVSLRVRTGTWAQEEGWIWPEEMTLQGVLKEDEVGLYLWVAAASQVIDEGVQLDVEPLGTALVTTEADGTHYAARTVLASGALRCTPVAVLQGRAVVAPEDASDLLWDIDESKGYLRNTAGKYLQAASSGTNLKWADKADDYCVWSKNAEAGYWKRDAGARALIGNLEPVIKNYSQTYIGAQGYSTVPAVDMPLYAGYLRTLTPGRWGTVCVPYAVRRGDLAGALFFEIKGRLDDADGHVRSVVLSGPVDHLDAGVPYVTYAETSALTLLYAGEPVAQPLSRCGLQGSFDGINTEKDPENAALEGMYVFSNNVLHKCMAGSSMSGNKAYVDLEKVPVLDQLPAGALRIQVNAGVTGICRPDAGRDADARIYSLQGVCLGVGPQCLEKLPKGIYIANGIKFVVK